MTEPEHEPLPNDTKNAPRSADELLPPVQPPAASFIMQLFLIPLLIVSAIVGVWMLFSWIANMGTQPVELVNDIEHLNHASWQKALTLANTLRDPRSEHLREDSALAGRVATLLEKQLESDQFDRDNLWLQIYLCRVLGEFTIDDGLPVLLKAIERSEPPEVSKVQRSALQATALLISRVGADQALTNGQLVPVLIQASKTPDTSHTEKGSTESPPSRLRSTAAYALGLLDDPTARDRLAEMLNDADTDVQFNAAVSLARLVDERAFPKLPDMLDPPNDALTAEMDDTLPEPEKQRWLQWKRNLIVSNALQAIETLFENQASISADVRGAVEQVAQTGNVNQEIRSQAKALASRLNDAL